MDSHRVQPLGSPIHLRVPPLPDRNKAQPFEMANALGLMTQSVLAAMPEYESNPSLFAQSWNLLTALLVRMFTMPSPPLLTPMQSFSADYRRTVASQGRNMGGVASAGTLAAVKDVITFNNSLIREYVTKADSGVDLPRLELPPVLRQDTDTCTLPLYRRRIGLTRS